MQFLGQAVSMDPNNPRANIFLGQMALGMAQFFGSPTDQACERAQKALDLFNAQEDSKTMTHHGAKENAQELVNQCGK